MSSYEMRVGSYETSMVCMGSYETCMTGYEMNKHKREIRRGAREFGFCLGNLWLIGRESSLSKARQIRESPSLLNCQKWRTMTS